jgi:hypothetical protein
MVECGKTRPWYGDAWFILVCLGLGKHLQGLLASASRRRVDDVLASGAGKETPVYFRRLIFAAVKILAP